mmetsp:Transcript_95583/g.169729  ORF Transcript_95583/g.169729 Transcript_95583/m.169729 type:complete len:203 (-) Transcript_95583:1046-1654(-)
MLEISRKSRQSFPSLEPSLARPKAQEITGAAPPGSSHAMAWCGSSSPAIHLKLQPGSKTGPNGMRQVQKNGCSPASAQELSCSCRKVLSTARSLQAKRASSLVPTENSVMAFKQELPNWSLKPWLKESAQPFIFFWITSSGASQVRPPSSEVRMSQPPLSQAVYQCWSATTQLFFSSSVKVLLYQGTAVPPKSAKAVAMSCM